MFFLVTTVNCDSIRGVQYFDCQAEYAQLLCLENILSAQEAAVTALNYVVVTQLLTRGHNSRDFTKAVVVCWIQIQ